MEKRFFTCLAMIVSLSPTLAYSQGFPEAPPRIQEAEAQGLARVSAAELKTLLQGPLQFFGESYTGQKARSQLVFSPDGTVERKVADTTMKGTWYIDESKQAYCTAFTFQKKGFEKNCFAVFRTADGIHYFDYDTSKGFDVHVWRRTPGN